MANQFKRDQWMQDIETRQRNVVFPNTVENETRFWRNLGTGPSKTSTKLGLAVLGLFVFGFGGAILVATYKVGVIWWFLLAMLLLCGPIFGAIAWATRKSLRDIEKARRDPKLRKH
jgi:H+/Cl- antiporter ClcA